MVESTREVSGSVKVGENNPKNVWWNNEIKAAIRKMKPTWKEELTACTVEAKERCMEAYREEKS